jgi:MarR family transcriptional regulator, transcriptional regulator for hemolysin
MMSGNSFSFLLADNARLFRQALEKVINEAGLGLTAGELRALSHVARHHGSRQAALAERMGVEPMTLSAYLDRLETRKLITRTIDPSDRRAKVIHTTEAAEKVFEQLRPLVQKTFARATQGVPASDLKRLDEVMTIIRANLTSDPGLLYDKA